MAILYVGKKRLNTDTAEHICNWWTSGIGKNDFRYEDVDLYRTRKGTWFLHGEGGAMTRWAHCCSDGTQTWGTDAEVLSLEEAYEWLVRRNEMNEGLEEYFTDIIEEG